MADYRRVPSNILPTPRISRMVDESTIRSETEWTEYERRMIERTLEEPTVKIALEAERVYEELPHGQGSPEFADGTRAFAVTLRESVAEDLYYDLKRHFDDE